MSKNPSELADESIAKKLGEAIADRKLAIRKLRADIKKLEKEINEIETGDLTPAPTPPITITIKSPPYTYTPNPYTNPFNNYPPIRYGTTTPNTTRNTQ